METKTEITKAIPEGYLVNAAGHLVPVEMVSEVDMQEDELVRSIAKVWSRFHAQLADAKAIAMADIQAHIDLAAEKYSVNVGGKKGNVTLMAFDGRTKVQRKINDDLTFGVELQAAKALIDECLHEWTSDSAPEVRALIDYAFQVDKEGKISTSRVLGLRRINIEHPKWEQAMRAISDSIKVVSSKAYIHVYKRISNKPDAEWMPVYADIARV